MSNRLLPMNEVGELALKMSDFVKVLRGNSYKFTTEELESMKEVIDWELNFRENERKK